MELISAGIDIGTTTTRVAISRLRIQDTASGFRLPEMRIAEKKLLYRGEAQLTPRTGDEVDGVALGEMIAREYLRAGVYAGDISTGAVIFTGEAARCRNAPQVATMLSRLAGGFLVACAGADMEGVLAAKGSGAAALSRGGCLLHTDIGGGTSNLCLLVDGNPVDTGCLDIGGRLIRYQAGTRVVASVSPPLKRLGLDVRIGETLSAAREAEIAALLADILAQALYLKPQTAQYCALLADHGIARPPEGCKLSFSGGVGELMESSGDRWFDDIGPALARAIVAHPLIAPIERLEQTGAATVMGAADFSTSLSGGTIHTENWSFPLTGLQAVSIRLESSAEIETLPEALANAQKRGNAQTALVLHGLQNASFAEIEAIAEALAEHTSGDLVVLLQTDMAKALGQALSRRTSRRVLCLDGLAAEDGDYIDIARPIGGVFPVVVHTLLFGR